MGIRKYLGRGAATPSSIKRWLGTDNIKQNSQLIGSVVKDLYKVDPAKFERKETFAQSMQRYGLDELALAKRMRTCLTVVKFCLGGAAFIALYSIYLFWAGHFLSGLLALMLVSILAVNAFREHFHYYQMRQRRLGCTLKEWFFDTVRGVR